MTTKTYPPGPRSLLPGGQLFAFQRDPLRFLTRAAQFGDISYFKFGSTRHAFLLNHPDYIKDVLVTHHENFIKGRGLQRSKRLLGEGLLTSEKDFHRRQRRLAQPAFHRQRIAAYAKVMIESAEQLSASWQEDKVVDIAAEMNRLTLGIVGRTLFGANVEAETREIGEALTALMKMFWTSMLPFAELLEKLPLPTTRRFHEARSRLDAVIYRMIEERRQSNSDRGDLLSMLLLAQDEEGGGSMTDEQLRDEAMTIFLAGHETTANALAWTWYLLAQHPKVEAKLHDEIDSQFAERLPTAEDVPKLRYTEMVLAESMRLYPPAWTLGRQALNDYGVNGYTIPAGSLVLLSQYVTHHDARYFPDPFRFDPERWTPEAKDARPQFSYFPFGGGPRRCIGEGFAWIEGILLIATLAREWRMHLAPNHPAVAPQPLVTLRPKQPIQVTLKRRHNVSDK